MTLPSTPGQLIAIDPGTVFSAYVRWEDGQIAEFGKINNYDILMKIDVSWPIGCPYVVEMIASYGRPVGQEVFETCWWIGRFCQAVVPPRFPSMLYRREVTKHLCGSGKGVTDAVVRQRLIDLYGPDKPAAIGTKNSPGPLYGIKADCWQALALGIVYGELHLGWKVQ